jgi:hypothetical protein
VPGVLPDGRRLASVSPLGGTAVRLWDVETGLALARFEPPAGLIALPVLAEVLGGDPDPDIRRCAALAVGRLGREAASAVPALTRALADPAAGVRACAALALAVMGEAATAARAELTAALRDPVEEVRANAAAALERLEPPPPVAPGSGPASGSIQTAPAAGRRIRLGGYLVSAGLVVVGLVLCFVVPWGWLVGVPLALLGGVMLTAGEMLRRGVIVLMSCPACGKPAMRTRGGIVCRRCGVLDPPDAGPG